MLRIKNKDLVDGIKALTALGDMKDVPTPFMFRVKRVVTVCRAALTIFTEAQQDLLVKYSKKNEKKEPIKDEKDNFILEDVPEYVKQMKILLDEEIDLDARRIRASILPLRGLPGATLLADLDWLIEDDLNEDGESEPGV